MSKRLNRDLQRSGAAAANDALTIPNAWLRRRVVIDRVVAAVIAILTAPVVAVLALAIRREDGGPPLIRVSRMGRHGTPFGMWKLRSMRATSADGLAAGANLTNGTADERITPIGRRLRAYHLDELPQLWNVATGEMSLLGPRPETPEFVNLNDDRWREVLSVPPGIAGPTQLIVSDWEREVIAASPDNSGYRNAVVPVKLAIDQWYLQAASPATDLLVAVTLLRRFLPGTEAWTLRHRVFADVAAAAPAHAFLRAHQAARAATRSADRQAPVAIPPWRRWRERLAHELDARVAHTTADPTLGVQPVPHDLVWSALMDGELVLYDSAHELAHHLSPEAAIVWQRCDGVASVATIARRLADELAVDREQMLRDVATVVLHLTHAGALVDARDPADARVPIGPGPRRWHPVVPPPGVPILAPEAFGDRAPAHVSSTFDALGYRFRVRADDARLGQAIEAALAPLQVAGAHDRDYWIVGVGCDTDFVQLYLDGEHLYTFTADDDPVGMVVWYLNHHAVEHTPWLAVHAAAVEQDGEVVVMPAASGAGKTTVAASLVAGGFGYVTEEVVALDPATGAIVPYSQSFCLAPGSQSLFEDLQPDIGAFSHEHAGDTWFVHPDRVRPDCRSAGGAVTAVIVPAYRPRALLLFDPLTPAETLLNLLSSTMNLDRIGHEGFLRLVELARFAPGYRLEYSDLADASETVRGAVVRHVSPMP